MSTATMAKDTPINNTLNGTQYALDMEKGYGIRQEDPVPEKKKRTSSDVPFQWKDIKKGDRYMEDESTHKFKDYEDLQNYLQYRKDHDEWFNPFINELGAVGIPNEPTMLENYCKSFQIQRKYYKLAPDLLGTIDYTDQDNKECIEDLGIFLMFPYHGKLKLMPTRYTALQSMCSRGDDACGTMLRTKEKANKDLLPVNEKAERLSRDFSLYSDRCYVLYRDCKVAAVLSKDYRVLPADELLFCLEDQLSIDHPDYQFDSGEVSQEYLYVKFLVNDLEFEETMKQMLNDAGCDIQELKAGIRFSTSDVGLSKVRASVYYSADGVEFSLGKGIEMEHSGNASIANFSEQMSKLGMLLKECDEQIEILGNTELKNPAACILAIREEYSWLPKGITEQIVDNMRLSHPDGGTALDVYLALNDIIQRHKDSAQVSPTRYLELCESVAKLMFLPYDKIDKGEDWK